MRDGEEHLEECGATYASTNRVSDAIDAGTIDVGIGGVGIGGVGDEVGNLAQFGHSQVEGRQGLAGIACYGREKRGVGPQTQKEVVVVVVVHTSIGPPS